MKALKKPSHDNLRINEHIIKMVRHDIGLPCYVYGDKVAVKQSHRCLLIHCVFLYFGA